MSALPRLEDAFALGEELGRGGFGVVYRGAAEDGRPVAIKISSADTVASEQERILREAAMLRKMEHPNLVEFLGVYQHRSGSLALVFELVEGEGLDRLLSARTLPVEEALGWLRSLARALDALHEAGLVHRDVKPANVMIRPGGEAVLLDFGLARPEAPGATLTATGMVVGTPNYMAPELFAGERAQAPADRYSFAALAYEMLTGRRVYEGGPAEVLRALEEGPDTPTGVRPQLGRPVNEVLLRGLAVDPAARPASCGAFVGALAAVLEAKEAAPTRVVEARVTPPVARVVPPRRLGWWAASVLVGLVGLAAWWLHPAPVRPPETPTAPVEVPSRPDPVPEILEEFRRAQLLRVEEDGRVLDVEHASPEAREFLDRDPIHFGDILEALPATRRLMDSLVDGGGAGVSREGLARIDAAFADEGLAEPFLVFRSVREEPTWYARALRLWERAEEVEAVHHRAMSEHDFSRAKGALRRSLVEIAPFAHINGYKAVELTWPHRKNRLHIPELLAGMLPVVRRLYHALGRSFREETENRDALLVRVVAGFPGFRTAFFSELSDLDAAWMVGARASGPYLKVLHARILDHQGMVQRRANGDWGPLWEREQGYWFDVLERSTEDPEVAFLVRSHASVRLVRMAEEMKAPEVTRRVFARVRGEYQGYRSRERVRLCFRFLQSTLLAEDPLGAEPEEIRTMARWLREDEAELPTIVRKSGAALAVAERAVAAHGG